MSRREMKCPNNGVGDRDTNGIFRYAICFKCSLNFTISNILPKNLSSFVLQNLVDLAGSERAAQTGAEGNENL